MLSPLAVILAGLLWLGLLFGVAVWGERYAARLSRHWGTVYALSLAVYCTSWTFYGTVTQAARSGWPLPPTFVGTILLYLFGIGLLRRLVQLARSHHASSIADLIATRLGKDSWLAAAVTAVALFGMIPYIALQLKAVAMSFGLLTRASDLAPPPWQDSALFVALAMALFAMLFGTRRASALEHNRGLVLAMAFESLLKLGAMLSVGALVLFGLPETAALATPRPTSADGFAPLVVLGALAMFTLPHQFHLGVVECQDPRHLRQARWLFPLYMLLIALPILPLARAGDARLAAFGVPSDLYVLALPLSQGHTGVALGAFLGGLSAATGMVILATLSLSLMIGNHWLTPLLLRRPWARHTALDLPGTVLLQRRVAIVAVIALAWGYSRLVAGSDALADIGAVSFSALGTLAPALAFAVWRPQTPGRAVLVGLLVGFAVWLYALPLPGVLEALGHAPAWLQSGPFGIAWLAPDHLFGWDGWSRLGRAVGLSLLLGPLATFVLASRWRTGPSDSERLAPEQLREVCASFLPARRWRQLQDELGPHPELLERQIERELAAVLGAASTRLLFDAARREAGRDLEKVATIVGEAAQALRFNQRVLEAALHNMSQGISVVDRELRLVAWNRRYAELFRFPEALLQVGRPIADLAEHALLHGFGPALATPAQVGAEVERRLAHMRAGSGHLSERRFPDGTQVEIRGNPMPGGGFVATFTDVTAFRHAESALKRANETLEQRVAERTSELDAARHSAERANQGKSRFLAAVGHDLMQPLHAAQLFAHALAQQLRDQPYRAGIDNVRGALASTEALLAGLLDLSRLEGGGLEPEVRAFALSEVLDHLAAESAVLASEQGQKLDYVASRAWVRGDPALLRRVLQNFLSNAIRYSLRGRMLLGVRRGADHCCIAVLDTGPGIGEGERALIFEEFRRGGGAHGQGLGLGLAIAERSAALLGQRIELQSTPGRGSCFAIRLPRAEPDPLAASRVEPQIGPTAANSSASILVVDNDASVAEATASLLAAWGYRVGTALDAAAAHRQCRIDPPALLILDYHLDAGLTGLALWQELVASFGPLPALVISADHSE
ncbi:MAG: PAS-domain containing protein, partial [Lysobacterales bacterium]